ncbi:hypothetical protein BCR39DRAFT_544068 [Naematelia encephala]|uniref:DUF2867 domain-containing protein n=1 Tax=Naematelia encephala TaxID=71784 RepID=A0A1Y2ASK9_9TREE|nr:hypothetical protein BCR39DRAFT_544068 [Naematelia encephala]
MWDPSPVTYCQPPTDCGIAKLFENANLLDSYVADISEARTQRMRDLAVGALGHPPLSLQFLLKLRDILVTPFGIRTTSSLGKAGAKEDRVEFFPVIKESSDEIILGVDDRHLDFRLSVYRKVTPDRTAIYMTTVVHCHNWLGRLYLFAITPFHWMVARSALARLHHRLEAKSS